MNPIKALKLFGLYERFEAIEKEKASMKVKLPQLLALFVTLSATIGLPNLVTDWVHAHVAVYTGIVAAALVLHAIMPSVFAAPSDVDTKATGLNKLGVILFWFACAGMLSAQTAPSTPTTSNGFSGASEAVAVFYNGDWSAGTHVTESYDFLDFGAKKTNHLYVEGHELLAPAPGFNIYAGGLKVEPDLTALMNKTNVGAGNFGVYVSGAVGNGMPSSGGSHVSFLAGGGVKYKITNSLTWQSLQAQYGRFGSNSFAIISTGLSFIFTK